MLKIETQMIKCENDIEDIAVVIQQYEVKEEEYIVVGNAIVRYLMQNTDLTQEEIIREITKEVEEWKK